MGSACPGSSVSRYVKLAVLAGCLLGGTIFAGGRPQLTVAAGAGYGWVSYSPGSRVTGHGPNLGGMLGLTVSSAVTLGLEFAAHHLNDEDPAVGDITANGERLRMPRIFRTGFVMLTAQVEFRSGIFVRPALGVGFNRFPVYTVGRDEVLDAGVSSEAGIAYGAAAGYRYRFSPALSAALEVIGRRSEGEDSTNPRTAAGFQVMIVRYF